MVYQYTNFSRLGSKKSSAQGRRHENGWYFSLEVTRSRDGHVPATQEIEDFARHD